MQWLKKLIKKIKYELSRESCYDEMALKGYATNEKCGGVTGGDSFSNYLSYSCMDCPYFSLNESEE